MFALDSRKVLAGRDYKSLSQNPYIILSKPKESPLTLIRSNFDLSNRDPLDGFSIIKIAQTFG